MNKLLFYKFVSHFFFIPFSFEEIYKEFLYRLTDFAPNGKMQYWQSMKAVNTIDQEYTLCLIAIGCPSDIFPLLRQYFVQWSSLVINAPISVPVRVTSKSSYVRQPGGRARICYEGEKKYPIDGDFSIDVDINNDDTHVEVRVFNHISIVLREGATEISQVHEDTIHIRLVQPWIYDIYELGILLGSLSYLEYRRAPWEEGDHASHAFLKWKAGGGDIILPPHTYPLPFHPVVSNAAEWEEFSDPIW